MHWFARVRYSKLKLELAILHPELHYEKRIRHFKAPKTLLDSLT
jgi:hypothetical protein